MIRIIHTIILLLVYAIGFSQNPDANKILERVKANLLMVKDYSADAKIKVDVKFVKIPEKQAKVYYKHPDKIKFKAKGFAMLPKKGINNLQQQLLQGKYTAIYIQKGIVDKVSTHMIKLIPSDDKSGIVIATMWVDDNDLVRKVESTTKDNGSYTVSFFYAKHPLNLPDKLIVQFDVNKAEIPVGFSLDFEQLQEADAKAEPKKGKGTVSITYSNYIVNKGVPDSVFK